MEEIVKILKSIAGRYNYHIVFQDWVECMTIAIQNSCCIIHDKLWQEREQSYLNIMGKYTKDERTKFAELMALLVKAYEEKGPEDILGEIYMGQGSGNKNIGQFFTPFHLSELCAGLQGEDIRRKKKIHLYEPSTGAGGMLVAVCKHLKEHEINYQQKLKVVAQDLDWNAIYMTYVQMSLLGVDAIVVQGDTLAEPYIKGKTPKEKIFRTPRNMGVLI